MFTMYVNVKKKTVLGVACAVVVLACGVFGLRMGLGGTLDAMQVETTGLTLKKADQNARRVEFLTGLGWVVEEEPCEIREVVIPDELDETYLKYNELQMTQGFDLSVLCGERIKRYTYIVTNYEGETEVHANMLVHKGKLVGGDICSTRLDGFMQGLKRQTATDALAENDATEEELSQVESSDVTTAAQGEEVAAPQEQQENPSPPEE